MTAKFHNLATQRFGRWLALYPIPSNKWGRWNWLCVCVCGTVSKVARCNLTNGHSKSCGCLQRELSVQGSRTHGKSNTAIYLVYKAMVNRCNRKSDPTYARYGARGIRCQWKTFADFYRDMGDRPGPEYTIERKDNNGPYCKENCRWATRTEQANNRRTSAWLTYQGETRTLMQWARHFGIPDHRIHARLRLGWTVDEALTVRLRGKPSVRIARPRASS
jgi:hypothetical protein